MEEITGAFVNDIDAWIERLYTCKPLSEAEVKLLCEKVVRSACTLWKTNCTILIILIGQRGTNGGGKRTAS